MTQLNVPRATDGLFEMTLSADQRVFNHPCQKLRVRDSGLARFIIWVRRYQKNIWVTWQIQGHKCLQRERPFYSRRMLSRGFGYIYHSLALYSCYIVYAHSFLLVVVTEVCTVCVYYSSIPLKSLISFYPFSKCLTFLNLFLAENLDTMIAVQTKNKLGKNSTYQKNGLLSGL